MSDIISLSELKNKIRQAFQQLVKPLKSLDQLPPIPDSKVFNITRGSSEDYICTENDKAISIDINFSSDSSATKLNITFCSLLEFDLEGAFNADGLLDTFEDSLDLEVEGSYFLDSSFAFGAMLQIERKNNVISAEIAFDPIAIELSVNGNLSTTVSFGLGIQAKGDANVALNGKAELVHCPTGVDCSARYPEPEYSNISSFYYSSEIGYNIGATLGLESVVSGLEIDEGIEFGIEDGNIFDDIKPIVHLPDTRAILDSIKFSPQAAVSMLRLVDSEFFCAKMMYHNRNVLFSYVYQKMTEL